MGLKTCLSLLVLLNLLCLTLQQDQCTRLYSNCAACVGASNCGWCAETKQCQTSQGTCVQWSDSNCYYECAKHDYDCNVCISQNVNSTCGWCHDANGTMDFPVTGAVCLNTQAGTGLPNSNFTCKNWITPSNGFGCPNCTKISNCTQCISNSLCGICVPNELPAQWQCQEGNNKKSFEFCSSGGTNPPETWSTNDCSPLCPTYSTCRNCAKFPHCSWCSTTLDGYIGRCLAAPNTSAALLNTDFYSNIEAPQCAGWFNDSNICPGNSSSLCENRVSCGDCALTVAGSPYECGWCEIATTFACVNATAKGTCPDVDWHTVPTNCPVHCPGYPISECSGKGTCNNETTCECVSEYYGPLCGEYCSDNVTCTGHGACFYNNRTVEVECQCTTNYFGFACETFCESTTTCGGHGVCDAKTGQCNCQQGFAGAYCEPVKCINFLDCWSCVADDPGSCVWCESTNQCMTQGNNASLCASEGQLYTNASVCNSDSCSDLSQEDCLSGDYCQCFWCSDFSVCWNTAGQDDFVDNICKTTHYKCDSSNGLSGGLIALIVLLCVGFVLVVGGVVLYAYFKKRGGFSYLDESQPLNMAGSNRKADGKFLGDL